MYTRLTHNHIQKLEALLGADYVLTDRDRMMDYAHDEYPLDEFKTFPEAVVKPGSTAEVCEIVRFCNQEKLPLTPRGAGTGLCGGCVPLLGGIVISLERMNRVLEVDRENLMVEAEAGVPLSDFYQAVEGEKLFFPPHPGDESATVGGVIATNAGGARAVKYGVVRNFVRGIEVVLPQGDAVVLGGKIIKNSSGYNLMQLLIGSEGTLGIVTRAFLNLMAPPAVMYTLIVPFESLEDAIGVVPSLVRSKILPMAVEFIEIEPIRVAEDFLNKKWPCQDGAAHLMIIIDAQGEEEIDSLAESVGEICLERGAIDVFVADNREKQRNILEIRSHIYETMKRYLLEVLDVSVPRSEIAKFVADVHGLEEELGAWLPTYGHAADGNVHTHIMKARWQAGSWAEIEGWKEKYPVIRERIHRLGKGYRGVVSGEHGIGAAKKEFLDDFIGGRQVELMRGIKDVFDPNGILNPGKIFR